MNVTFPPRTQIYRYASADFERVWYWVKPDELFGPIRDCAYKLGSCPAVFTLGEAKNNLNSHNVLLTRELQFFNADLMALSEYGQLFGALAKTQKEYVGSAFRGVFGNNKAFANGTGFQGKEPKADFVNRKDIDAGLPAYDKIRTCATNNHTGDEVGDMLRIDTFDTNDLPKNFGVEILQDSRVFWATIQYKGGEVNKFPNLTKGVPVALVSRYPVYYPLARLYRREKRPLYYRKD